MDTTATTLCMDNDIPIIVFNINENGNLKKVLSGEKIGTIVENKIGKQNMIFYNGIIEEVT